MRAGSPFTQNDFPPADLQVVLPEPLQGARTEVLVDAVHERLARRMSLEGAVDHPRESIRQPDIVGARSRS